MPPEAVDGKAVVVVDTLRATTTMAAMLANQAEAVLPIADLREARRLKAELGDVLLAGERSNRPPPDFDGGNSPLEYPGERVAGRRIILTTTNGTHAIERCRLSRALSAGALVNAAAVARWLGTVGRDAVIVLAGQEGELALEDWLAGGAIVERAQGFRRSDAAEAARLAYCARRDDLLAALRDCEHGHQLWQQGMQADLVFASREDSLNIVPVRSSEPGGDETPGRNRGQDREAWFRRA